MGGKSTSESQTQQTQSGTVAPWEPTQGILNNILTGIGQQSYAPTAAQTGALQTLQDNAQNVGNYAPQATSLANDLMTGGGTGANAGILSDAFKNYQTQLSPYANGQNLDPMSSPGMQSVLDTIRGDISNQVNSQFAGAGRDLSGMNMQALGRGVSQGMAAPLLAQYNQNVQNQLGAAGNLFNAGSQTATGLQGFNQQGYQNRATGLDTAINGIPAAQNNQANQILQAGNQAFQLPLQNLGLLSNLTIPIAGLGSQSTGTAKSNTQGSQTMSGAQQFATIGAGFNSFMNPFRSPGA